MELATIARSRIKRRIKRVVDVWWGHARAELELEDTNFNDMSSALLSNLTANASRSGPSRISALRTKSF
jgi:hypothetical protein